jgi:holo-[acyl-carrier protein] synthase
MQRCGVDLVEVKRVRSAAERHGEHFLARVFTAEERGYCASMARPWPHYAARFAAKEAFYKAIPAGILAALVWSEVGVRHGEAGEPELVLGGETARRLAGWRFSLSLSHGKELAIAVVLAQPPV